MDMITPAQNPSAIAYRTVWRLAAASQIRRDSVSVGNHGMCVTRILIALDFDKTVVVGIDLAASGFQAMHRLLDDL